MASYKLHMPQMGESIHEATVLRWMVEEGAIINQDDIILEVATDKVDSEIPSPVTGQVKNLYVSEGEVVNVGAVIADIETDEDPETGLGTLELEHTEKQPPASENQDAEIASEIHSQPQSQSEAQPQFQSQSQPEHQSSFRQN